MKYKLFFGISVLNVFLIVSVIAYALASKLVNFDAAVMELIRYTIIGLAIGTPIVWTILIYLVNCPHCGDKALAFIIERSKEPKNEQVIPLVLRPFTFMINKEYFAGYCHCMSCQGKINFDKDYAEVCDESVEPEKGNK